MLMSSDGRHLSQRRGFFSEATMAKSPEQEEPLELTDGDTSAQPAASTS